ncbi:ATP-binding cassette domain-containing protein [Ferrimonas lipolytica]|uniref:ATP-binding cassette domain-containing protein n=1 Tax=Ferrimonas lipolytica TaxID=2724191 RepID=A0A6H1UHE9_9GAMM|nr:ATP-binding cassette domain-containing protein [Ferrimonas lipolytica]QIZ78030.1 ATP-binding cassette domain-containing protein [Ferrimonas lipolytica]
MSLHIDLHGRLGDFVFNFELSLPLQGAIGIFGPSGVGKTSILRAICGLERELDGTVVLGDDVLQDSNHRLFVKAEKRGIGMVFQDSRLFPHLTVRKNLQLALNQTNNPIFGIDELARECDFEVLLDQPAPSLSAGQRQRVAIARALIAAPRLLLMDEPLAALDVDSRQRILDFLHRVSQRLPIIFISHSVAETLSLCDPIVVMAPGRVEAVGNAQQVDHLLPRRRGTGTVVNFDAERGEVTLRLDEFAPDFTLEQVVGLVSEPNWLRGRE